MPIDPPQPGPVTEKDCRSNASQCFYCPAQLGEPHKPDCVCHAAQSLYHVYLDGGYLGVYIDEDPVSWSIKQRHFHKNLGSWCSSNALRGQWLDPAATAKLEVAVQEQESWGQGDCLCDRLVFDPLPQPWEWEVDEDGIEYRFAEKQ